MKKISPADLTLRPPRSPRVRLGGFALLPRLIDKGRALVAATNGEYNYACPLDMLFFDFVSVDPKKLKKQISSGLGDGSLLEWINKNAGTKRSPLEIALWSRFVEDRVASDVEMREYFQGLHQTVAPDRTDVATWFDILDIDDCASFGGNV